MRRLFGLGGRSMGGWPVDESWCAQFVAPVCGRVRDIAVFGLTQPQTERFLRQVHAGPRERIILPVASSQQFWRTGWIRAEMDKIRVMPMREAIDTRSIR